MTAARVATAVFGVFVAWQAASGGVRILREHAAAPASERGRALTQDAQGRVEAFVPAWHDLLGAIERHVPRNGSVAFQFKLDEASFQATQRLGVLIQPRRAVPVVRPIPPAELERAAAQAAAGARAVYVADMASGFPLPSRVELVTGGARFTLWRLLR